MTSISDYADKIMAEVDGDIKAGLVPATVASFSELHDHVDANDYASQSVPQGELTWDAYLERLNEVEAEVNRRLRARQS